MNEEKLRTLLILNNRWPRSVIDYNVVGARVELIGPQRKVFTIISAADLEAMKVEYQRGLDRMRKASLTLQSSIHWSIIFIKFVLPTAVILLGTYFAIRFFQPQVQLTQTQVDLIVDGLWLVCIIVCFLKWKTWTAIFGVIGLILGNLPETAHLHFLVMGPATSLALAMVAIRLAKPVSWWAKWFYWGPMDNERKLLGPSPKLARALARFPEQATDFEKPGT